MIAKQILSASTQRNVLRPVWRIVIPMSGCKGLIVLQKYSIVLEKKIIASSDMNLCIFQNFLNKFQRAEDAMEYTRKTAAESASAIVSQSQSESLLEWFKLSDWLYKTKAVKSVKPLEFTICDSLQTKIVRQVEFNSFA